MTTNPKNYREAKKAGLVEVGEWGFPGCPAGAIWCAPGDLAAVQAAYDAIDEGDLGPDVLSDVFDKGGVFVPDTD